MQWGKNLAIGSDFFIKQYFVSENKRRSTIWQILHHSAQIVDNKFGIASHTTIHIYHSIFINLAASNLKVSTESAAMKRWAQPRRILWLNLMMLLLNLQLHHRWDQAGRMALWEDHPIEIAEFTDLRSEESLRPSREPLVDWRLLWEEVEYSLKFKRAQFILGGKNSPTHAGLPRIPGIPLLPQGIPRNSRGQIDVVNLIG